MGFLQVPKKDMAFVSIQFGLFFLFLFDLLAELNLPNMLRWIGLAVAVIGLIVVILALLQLKESLSPFPTPVQVGQLRTNGLYSLVRHPIYTGIILTCFGFGVYSESLWRILIGLALWVLFHFKSSYEETLLLKKYPDYEVYRKRTGKLFPKFLMAER
jgi:protein-S-isoprenylcysteine O-methyltransferase Ste14